MMSGDKVLRNGIIFDFYTGLPHIHVINIWKSGEESFHT